VSRYIAFFDFDGTITSKDTLVELIRFQKGDLPFLVGCLLNAPWLIGYRLGIISNHTAKQKLLRFFFRKMAVDLFQQKCDEFALKILPQLVRPKAMKEIRKLREIGAAIVIVSASANNWIQAWSQAIGADLIATVLETKNGRMTGNIQGRNCHGKEKVKRINMAYDLTMYEERYVYADTTGDRPMMALGTHAFYKPFR